MESPLNSETKSERTSFEKIAELEIQILTQKAQQAAAVEDLGKDIKSLRETLVDLMVILDALKTLGKIATLIEKVVVFLTKFGLAVGFMYAIYKFGLTELAKEITKVGGK